MKNRFKITVILTIILLFVTIYYYPRTPQPQSPENNQTDNETNVKIAVTYEKLAENMNTWPHPVSEEKIKALVTMAERDINQYCIDNQIETRFSFIPTPVIHKGGTQQGENPPGLDEIIQLNQTGINLIVGHDYSLANQNSLEYANTHKMLLLSPSGIGLGLSNPDDYLFKLIPNEYEDPEVYAKVLAQLLKSKGIVAYITIGTGEHILMREWLRVVGAELSYDYLETEVVMDINADDYGPYFEQATAILNDTIEKYGEDKVCVLMEPFWIDELEKILDQADSHEILSSVEWIDYVGMSEEGIIENHLEKRFSRYCFMRLIMYPAETVTAEEFYHKYIEGVGALPTPSKVYDEAARYDACWLMALSVLQANSTNPEVVKTVLPSVCELYEGVLGDCTLNENGDRVSTDYRVFRWSTDGEVTHFEAVGYYNSTNEDLFHYEDE